MGRRHKQAAEVGNAIVRDAALAAAVAGGAGAGGPLAALAGLMSSVGGVGAPAALGGGPSAHARRKEAKAFDFVSDLPGSEKKK